MDDVQVYEQIDGILKEMLTTKNLKENYQELMNNPNIALGQKCIKQYLESVGYTFFSQEDQQYKFLFKGKEATFNIFIATNNEVEIVLSEPPTNYSIIFFPAKQEIWRAKTLNLLELTKANPTITWTDGQASPHYFIPASDFSVAQQVFITKNISSELQ